MGKGGDSKLLRNIDKLETKYTASQTRRHHLAAGVEGNHVTAARVVLSVFRRYMPLPSVGQKTKRVVQIIFDICKVEPALFKSCSFICCQVYFYVCSF